MCSRNRRRSPTAERVAQNFPNIEARSAGTQPGARVVLSAGLIGWADAVFFMEESHLRRALLRFEAELNSKEVFVLDIPDDFEFMQAELVEELKLVLEEWANTAELQ